MCEASLDWKHSEAVQEAGLRRTFLSQNSFQHNNATVLLLIYFLVILRIQRVLLHEKEGIMTLLIVSVGEWKILGSDTK